MPARSKARAEADWNPRQWVGRKDPSFISLNQGVVRPASRARPIRARVGYGDKASNWGTGKEVDVLGFQKFTLRKRLKRVEQAAEKQLLSPADRAAGMRIEFNLEGLLRADSLLRAQVNDIALKNKTATINEVRAQDNKPPVPWGDLPWVQMQDQQLGTDGSVPALPAPSA